MTAGMSVSKHEFGIDAPWAVWWRRNAERAALAAAANVDVIVATMPPYQTAAAVTNASQKSGKPWIADLRDPWAFDEMRLFATGLHRRLEQRHMRQLLGSSAAIVTTTPELARRIAVAFPELADRPIVSIANGYDAADFAGPPPSVTTEPSGSFTPERSMPISAGTNARRVCAAVLSGRCSGVADPHEITGLLARGD